MKLYEAIASALGDEDSGPVFGVMGDGNMMVWSALAQQKKKEIIVARHEAGAVAMADGYYRATGKLAIATTTSGPGLTQIGTSLVAAVRNHTPMVLAVGEVPAGSKNKAQWVDQRKFVEACGARHKTITSTDTAADEIAEAFYAARINRVPVLLNMPNDLQMDALNWEWCYTLSNRFLPLSNEGATDEALAPIVEALLAAERPIILAGRGVRMSNAADKVIALADRAGALLATSLQAKGMFDGHPYDIGVAGTFAGAPAEALFADADFVLSFGAELGYYTTEGGMLFPTARIARVDIAPAPAELGVIPGDYIRGDAGKTAGSLLRLMQAHGAPKAGYRNEATKATMAIDDYKFDKAADGMDPRVLMHVLSRAIPRNVGITCGAGHYTGFVAMHLAIPSTADIQFTVQFAACGQGLATAAGIALGSPARPNLLIEGDGSLAMNIQELDTVVRQRIPLVVLVMNDGGYGAETHKLDGKGLDRTTALHGYPDFVALAKAFGGDGMLLGSEDELPAAIKAGFASKGLYLIDARISPTTPSDSHRKVHLGIPNTTPLLRSA